MRKSKLKEYTCYHDFHEVEISFLVGGTVADLIAFIKKRHGKTHLYSWDKRFKWGKRANTTDGYAFHVEGGDFGVGERYYLWVHGPEAGILGHEICHMVGDILYNRGYGYCYGSEEGFAYLSGWLHRKVHHALKGKIVAKL